MSKATAQQVADFFVNRSQQAGDPFTNLKIQKLVYYAQAWHLVFCREPLFDEKIKAWVHGPVVPQVYHTFKEFGWSPVTTEITAPNLDSDVVDHLDEVLKEYGHLTGFHLERLTHQELPWNLARGYRPPDEQSDAEITHAMMLDYYLQMAKDG